jgi:hypothetical protein
MLSGRRPGEGIGFLIRGIGVGADEPGRGSNEAPGSSAPLFIKDRRN